MSKYLERDGIDFVLLILGKFSIARIVFFFALPEGPMNLAKKRERSVNCISRNPYGRISERKGPDWRYREDGDSTCRVISRQWNYNLVLNT